MSVIKKRKVFVFVLSVNVSADGMSVVFFSLHRCYVWKYLSICRCMIFDAIGVLLSIGAVINKPHLVFLMEQALSQVSPRRGKWQMTDQTLRGFCSRIIQRQKNGSCTLWLDRFFSSSEHYIISELSCTLTKMKEEWAANVGVIWYICCRSDYVM